MTDRPDFTTSENHPSREALELMNSEIVHLYSDGTYRVSVGTDAAIDATHADYVWSVGVGFLLARLSDAEGIANRALTRTDRKLTPTDYKEVLGFIRTVAGVFRGKAGSA